MLDTVVFTQGEAPPPHVFEDSNGDGAVTGRTRVRVLVVDDERLIARTVASILNVNGFEAVEAFSGEEALEKARALKPDIVLTDVLMPRMTGVELGMRLRDELPEARILMFSGQAATSELMRKAQADGYDFELFPKPIHPDDLIAKLRGLSL
ncbi:MAG TPA: response regulator [Acidobacteriaceae bacterium]